MDLWVIEPCEHAAKTLKHCEVPEDGPLYMKEGRYPDYGSCGTNPGCKKRGKAHHEEEKRKEEEKKREMDERKRNEKAKKHEETEHTHGSGGFVDFFSNDLIGDWSLNI